MGTSVREARKQREGEDLCREAKTTAERERERETDCACVESEKWEEKGQRQRRQHYACDNPSITRKESNGVTPRTIASPQRHPAISIQSVPTRRIV